MNIGVGVMKRLKSKTGGLKASHILGGAGEAWEGMPK
jgi:hypothetical protein